MPLPRELAWNGIQTATPRVWTRDTNSISNDDCYTTHTLWRFVYVYVHICMCMYTSVCVCIRQYTYASMCLNVTITQQKQHIIARFLFRNIFLKSPNCEYKILSSSICNRTIILWGLYCSECIFIQILDTTKNNWKILEKLRSFSLFEMEVSISTLISEEPNSFTARLVLVTVSTSGYFVTPKNRIILSLKKNRMCSYKYNFSLFCRQDPVGLVPSVPCLESRSLVFKENRSNIFYCFSNR